MKTKRTLHWALLCLALTVATVACHPTTPAPKTTSSTAHSYPAKGIVEKIATDRNLATIHHQKIPGYMMEMTMDFNVTDPKELDGITPGDEIAFNLIVDGDNSWIEHIQRVGHIEQPVTNAAARSEEKGLRLKPGDQMPDVELLGEDGKPLHLSDLRGQAVALTFFFTRCPIPEYCPLMNRNMGQTRKILLSLPKAPGNWQLLSISFDEEFDHGENLSNYAGFYRGKSADHWLFACASPTALSRLGPPLGLMVMGQGGNLSHNLRTIVIDPQGRLYRQFNDNLWTPQQLADAISEAARKRFENEVK